MATSYRIRPNGNEAKNSVVVNATFTNPATDIPDSAVAVVIGDNVPAYRLDVYERIRAIRDAIREGAPWTITASQYAKFTATPGTNKAALTPTIVAGTDTASNDEITVYVGSGVNTGQTEYGTEAINYAIEVARERSKSV